ncbi:MAG: hypothetical protein AB1846_14400 [Chloroflexota bacterium]
MMKKLSLVFIAFILAACGSDGENPVGPQLVRIQYTAAAQPWLPDFYDCAEERSGILLTAELRSASDLDFGSAEVLLRVGEPDMLASPTYQIGSDDILVAAHRLSPLQNINTAEVESIFSGQADDQYQVWVYAAGDDVQQVFEAAVMGGVPITSNARLAAGPQQMSDAVNGQENAVGVVTARWMTGSIRYIYTIPGVPVLAMVSESPGEIVQDLVACVQEKNGYSGN